MLELHDENYAAAIEIYGAAWKDARTEMESAEVLNALARCALKAGDLDLARDAHRKLSFYGLTLDADGAHPATMSYLRMAQHLGHERGAPVLSEWARGILDGRFPIYPGCRLALRDAMALAAQWREDGRDCRVLLSELAHVDGKIDFVSTYADILKSSSGERARYVSGTSETGESFLLYNSDLRQEKITGLLFDLGRLRETVADSEVGRRLQDRGFGFDLFDADHSPDFEAQYAETISVVTPASEWMERMQLGIYVADASSAIEYYRNRNLVILTGIFALAGFVALGGYMIFRDSTREMHLARLRSEFVSNVSHELRTPLAAIRMNAETLVTGRYRSLEKHDAFLQNIIMRESERLSRIVDNILTFSQIESGRKTYEMHPEDPAAIVRSALEAFEPMLEKRGFHLEVQIADGLSSVLVDREAIGIAVSNLISNAIKYSTEDKQLAVTIDERDETVLIEIADRGIGVPSTERERIFEKFHRASNASDGTATGTGVGLALTRSIMDAHGGQTELEPRQGGGSVFRLVLPKGDN